MPLGRRGLLERLDEFAVLEGELGTDFRSHVQGTIGPSVMRPSAIRSSTGRLLCHGRRIAERVRDFRERLVHTHCRLKFGVMPAPTEQFLGDPRTLLRGSSTSVALGLFFGFFIGMTYAHATG